MRSVGYASDCIEYMTCRLIGKRDAGGSAERHIIDNVNLTLDIVGNMRLGMML
jgi:hypothetical protein